MLKAPIKKTQHFRLTKQKEKIWEILVINIIVQLKHSPKGNLQAQIDSVLNIFEHFKKEKLAILFFYLDNICSSV